VVKARTREKAEQLALAARVKRQNPARDRWDTPEADADDIRVYRERRRERSITLEDYLRKHGVER